MSQIKILSDRVANQIAAGEVIERPVAAVKELVENSIDAKADRITIEIKNGGKSLIKITDNGSGMSEDQALLSLERHATSKLRQANDLNEIYTFGFRGEALPSVASISQFILKTRTEGSIEGTEIRVNSGKLIDKKVCGMPQGTSIEVSHLFNSVPARRKFLKSDATETAHIHFTVRLFALAHPNIAFELIDSGRVVLKSPSCARLADRISEVWNRNISKDLLQISANNEADKIEISGLSSKIGTDRSTRRELIFFVNNRPVDNKTLSYAVLDAYAGRIPKGRFPVAFLFLKVDPSAIDVNVHPTKREIRFRDEAKVRNFILNTIHSALEKLNSKVIQAQSTDIKDFPGAIPAPIFKNHRTEKESKTAENDQAPETLVIHPDHISKEPVTPTDDFRYKTNKKKASHVNEIAISDTARTGLENKEGHSPEHFNWKFITEMKKKYAVYNTPNGLVVLNILRAMQRIRYETILKQLGQHTHKIQDLIIPIKIELEPLGTSTLEAHLNDLSTHGFTIESFGKNYFRILGIPDWLKIENAEQFIKDLIDQLRTRGAFSKNPNQEISWENIAQVAIQNYHFNKPDQNSMTLEHLPDLLFKCTDPLVNPLGKSIFLELDWNEIEKRIS